MGETDAFNIAVAWGSEQQHETKCPPSSCSIRRAHNLCEHYTNFDECLRRVAGAGVELRVSSKEEAWFFARPLALISYSSSLLPFALLPHALEHGRQHGAGEDAAGREGAVAEA